MFSHREISWIFHENKQERSVDAHRRQAIYMIMMFEGFSRVEIMMQSRVGVGFTNKGWLGEIVTL